MSSRQMGAMGGEGYIPVSEISAYCDLMQITDVNDRADLLRFIRSLDAAYLDEREKQRERDKSKEPPPKT